MITNYKLSSPNQKSKHRKPMVDNIVIEFSRHLEGICRRGWGHADE